MAIETQDRPTFNTEQKEAWNKAKLLLKTLRYGDAEKYGNSIRYRALHIAMSELRGMHRKHKGPIETPAKNPNKLQNRQLADKYAQLRERVDSWKAYFDNPGKKKLYVICDHTLSEAQKAVQSAHAVAKFVRENPLAPWCNGTLVLLQPNNDRESKFVSVVNWYFSDRSWSFRSEWCEEDMDNRLTAVAILDDFNFVDNKAVRLL